MAKRIWGIQCPSCKQRMFSFHQHDFKYCGCGEVFVDGGTDYLRFGFKEGNFPKRIYWCKKDGAYPFMKKKDSFPY